MSSTSRSHGKAVKFDINRVLRRLQEGKGTLDECARVAEQLGFPLWVMFVPGILPGPDVERNMRAIVAIVEAYVKGYNAGVASTAEAQAA